MIRVWNELICIKMKYGIHVLWVKQLTIRLIENNNNNQELINKCSHINKLFGWYIGNSDQCYS